MKNKSKKLSFNSLALGNLKHRKKQYIFLIIGIIVSMFFSSASLFFIASAVSSIEETTINLIGKVDYIVPHANQIKNCEDALEYGFEKVGLGSFMGLAVNPQGKADDGFIITKFDNTGKDLYVKILEGNYPQSPNEIAIEKEALSRAGYKDAAIGDTITVNLYPQNKDKQLKEFEKAEFKLVGILQNRRVNIERACQLDYTELPAAVVSGDYRIPAGGNPSTFAIAYTNSNFDLDKYIASQEKFRDYLEIDDFLGFRVAEISMYVRYDWDLMKSVNPIYIAAFFGGMMALVANIGIVTAFSTNLKERKKQIGLLRCVGATKIQIVKIYLREAFVLSLICTPISILLALGLTYAVIPLFGEYFIFKPEFWTIPLSVLVSIIIVVLSAVLPLIPAARISPMQTIRNFDVQRKLKKFKVKTTTDFDVSKLIAKRNIGIMKAKNNLTSFIICASIFVSCFVLALAQIDTDEVLSDDFSTSYDYIITQGAGEGQTSFIANYEEFKGYSENDLSELLNAPYSEKVLSYTVTGGYIEVENLTEYMHALHYLNNTYSSDLQYLADKETALKDTRKQSAEYDYVRSQANIKGEAIKFLIVSLDDESLLDLQAAYKKADAKDGIQGEIDIKKMKSGEEVIVVAPDEIDILIEQSQNEPFGAHAFVNASWGSALFYGDEEGERLEPDFTYKRDFTIGQELKIGCIQANKSLEFGEDIYELGENKVPPVYKKSEHSAKIGAILNDNSQDYSFAADVPTIIISHDILSLFTSNTDYKTFAVKLNTECTKEIDALYDDIFDEISLGKEPYITSTYDNMQDDSNHIYTWVIIVLCVILVMFTLSGSLVNNSITSRIHQGRRSIGTLRAVGASEKELRASYIRQFISVMLKGVISGYIIFAVFCFIYYFVVRSYGEDFSGIYSPAYKYLLVPIALVTIPTLILFVSCCINMVSKIKKEMKNSIVENIREL